MAFPDTPLPIKVEISLDGTTWTDITSDVRSAPGISITRGRSNWGQSVDPGRCTFSLDNLTGTYSPRNPEGPYFGQIGRNTPVRVSVNTGSVALDLPGETNDYASTPDTAALDITGDIDVRIDATLANWVLSDQPPAGETVFSRTELIGKYASSQRSWVLYIRKSKPYFSWSTSGTSETNTAEATADLPLTTSGRIAVRATLDVDNGASGNTVTFYTAPTIDGPWNQLGDPVTASGTTSIFSGSSSLKIGDASHVAFDPAIGSVHAAEVRSGIGGTAVANPDFTAQSSGTTSFADGAGLTWTLTGNAEITNRKTRFVGEISSWTPRWDTGGFDVITEIEAAGVLRRLSQGAVPVKSPMYRDMTSPGRTTAGIVAYWPMEDGTDATTLASAFDDHPAMTYTDTIALGAYEDWKASAAIPTVTTGLLRATVPSYTKVSGVTEIGFFFKVPAAGVVSTQRLASWSMTSSAATWSIFVNTSGNLDFRVYDGEGVQTHASGFGSEGVNGRETFIVGSLTQVLPDIEYTFSVIDIENSLLTAVPDNTVSETIVTGSVSNAGLGIISEVRFGEDGAMNGTALGHLAVGKASTSFNATIGALVGWNAEEGPSRVSRIGQEESMHSYATGPGDEQCGFQPSGTALAIMQSAEAVDQGILAELRSVLGTRYVTRSSMYSQPPTLTLAYNGTGGLVAPLDPVDDDQDITNDVTVTRTDGSSARATLSSGALSTQAPPSGIGLYDTSYTVDLLNDTQPPYHAGWRLHLGTWDETRYPVVTVNLANAPGSIENATAIDTGSRIQITDSPAWLPPDTVDLLVEGYTETMSQYVWTLAYNCSPYGPWKVGALATYEDFEDTTYEFPITDGGDLPWVRSSAQAHTGTFSFKSGAITHNQTSDAIITPPANSTEMRFWYWTDSEAAGGGFDGDRLLVFVDATQVLSAQGSTAWTQAIVDVTGAVSVTFRYDKDNSVSTGSDSVHIDDVSFTGYSPTRVDTDGSEIVEAASSSATSLTVATTTTGPLWTTSETEMPFDVRAAGEVMTVTDVASWLTDAFGRTVSGGWGSADTGQAWTAIGGTVASDYAVGSGYGSHTLASLNTSRRTYVAFTHDYVDMYSDITVDATAAGTSLFGGLMARYTDVDNLYMARVEFQTSGSIALQLRKRVGGTESTIGSSFDPLLSYTPGTNLRMRFQVIDSRLRTKIWDPTGNEPDWMIDETDTSLTSGIGVGARSITGTGNTNVNPQLRYDDMEFVNPQTFTVTRSTNTVVKAQTAGTSISLADPAYTAL